MLTYAEIHYRPFGIPSLVYRKQPEILFDAPRRVAPGNPIPLFILIKDAEQRKKVAELAAKAKNITNETELEKTLDNWADELQKEMYRKALPVQEKMLVSSPELLIVCFRLRKPLKECETLYDLNDLASVWMCIENILLAMTAEGLYGVTSVPRETASLKKVLGIPEGYDVAAAIPIGYPENYPIKQKTISLEEKLHYNKWENI